MTAVKITRHAMGFIKECGHDDAVENMWVVTVGPAKDFLIKHHRSQTPKGASTLRITRNRRIIFEANLGRNWEHDDALITEIDDSIAKPKTWASEFLGIQK